MNFTSYLTVFRTHVWDQHVAEIAEAARTCCRSGAFLVGADESKQELPIENFYKFSHSDEFPELNLPSEPRDRALWWNADYPPYSVFLSLRDNRLRAPESMAHPVLVGRRFVAAYVNSQPEGGHLMTGGCLCPELEDEDPSDVAAIVGTVPRFTPPGPDADPCAALVDVAHGKPATHSGWSPWSRAATAEADACLANSGALPDDYAFHTMGGPEAWWAVDLLEPCCIDAVEIINRLLIEERFHHFRIDTRWTVRPG